MRYFSVPFLLAGFAAASLSANAESITTVSDAVAHFPSSQAKSKLVRPDVVPSDSPGSAFLLPVVGNTAGKFGTYFRSDTTLSNFRNVPQRIAISVLRQGISSGNDPVIIRQLPGYESGGDLGLVDENFLESLGKTGLAALVVQAVDADGKPDPKALIDGFSRIWTNQPPGDGCLNPQGTVSQSLFAVPTTSFVGDEFPGFAVGLRQDENFRTNVGIVNFSAQEHTWTIEVGGTRGSTSLRVTVPAFSMQQAALLPGIFGTLSVVFVPDRTATSAVGAVASNAAADFRWAAYASSVDNRSADGWVRQASY